MTRTVCFEQMLLTQKDRQWHGIDKRGCHTQYRELTSTKNWHQMPGQSLSCLVILFIATGLSDLDLI